MIPLASAEHSYTYYFNPKSASSTYRSLFVELHRGELPEHASGAVDIHDAFQHFHPRFRFTHENFMTGESKSLMSAIYAQELKAYDCSPDR